MDLFLTLRYGTVIGNRYITYSHPYLQKSKPSVRHRSVTDRPQAVTVRPPKADTDRTLRDTQPGDIFNQGYPWLATIGGVPVPTTVQSGLI